VVALKRRRSLAHAGGFVQPTSNPNVQSRDSCAYTCVKRVSPK
jgi:hypothetical protein